MKKTIQILHVVIPSLLIYGVVYGATILGTNTDIAGTFDVTGAATFDSSLTVAGNTTLTGNLLANGDVSLGNLPADTLTLNAGLVYGVQTITTGIDFSPATLTTDIVLSNGATIDNASDGTVLVTGGTLRSGASAGVNAAGGRDMIYGYYKGITTALTGTGRGVYGRAVIDIDSPSGTLQGGQFKATSGSCASCADAVNLATATGLYVEVGHGNAGGTAKTLVNARALELNLDLDAADVAVTNAYGIYMKYNTGSSGGVITNGYGLWIDNESVQGTGQTMDAGFYLSDTSVATAGWDYGLDFSAASIGTADIRLSNGETIFNSPDGVIAFSGALKLPKDAASAADALNTTKPTGITCNADSLGTITWVDDTDADRAWLWICQQTAASSYDWYLDKTRLPATGQTVSYGTKQKDDGYYQTGAALSYDTYTVGGDVVVRDLNTGLEWEQKTLGNLGDTYNWENAQTYCEDQIGTSGTYGGHSDWRLPNAKELYGITKLDAGIGAPYIDTTYFPKTQSSYYWSSTTRPSHTDIALDVRFDGGDVGYRDKTSSRYVRCVRGQ